MGEAIERYFRLKDHGTTLRTEVLGGATTFATMAYIIVVNPAILQAAGVANVYTKSLGTTNPHNVIRATMKALVELRVRKVPEHSAAERPAGA